MQHNESKPIYILGAGPAGLAAAYTLAKQGYAIVVVERDDRVGGLAKSIEHQGFILDYGPHRFFTKLEPVLKLWDEVLGREQVTVQRLTRIYYGSKYFNYPLKAVETLSALGVFESLRIVISYGYIRAFPIKSPQNFAEWVTARFGKRLFEIFFESYTEKLWGISCREISADWAAQRIKGLSLLKAIRNALLGNDGKVKTLIDQFQFPRLGSGQFYDRIHDFLEQQQHSVLLNTEVVGVHHQSDRITQITLKDRQTGIESTVDCSAVISSIPITLLTSRMITPAPPTRIVEQARSLKFRNTVLVYLIVEGSHLFPDNWLYINEPSVQVGRVTNFANWSPDMLPNTHQTPLCCEYWCNTDDEMWQQPEAELLALAERELRKIKLLARQAVVGGFVVRLPRTYPVYAGNYKAILSDLQHYYQKFQNLQLVGRYGAFKYNNQDHSLLMGILAAENVATPKKHDLWTINSDSEYVEEASADVATTAAGIRQRSRRRQWIELAQQFAKYSFSGGLATIVDVMLFTAFMQAGLGYGAALMLSYLAGLSVNFWLSRRFVFQVYWRNPWLQYTVFLTVALGGLFANFGLLQLMVERLNYHPTIARLISALCVFVISFTGHKLYSFMQIPESVAKSNSKVD